MAFVDLAHKLKNRSSFSNQNGQALVEYVLILVVSVAMVMALAYQVFTPFQKFLKSYMGDYVACLLETGELPSLGNETTSEILAEEGCNAQFEGATLAGGRPSKSGSGNGSSGSKTDGKNSSSSSSSEGSSSSVGGSAGSSSSSRGGNLLVSSIKRKTATESGGAPDKVTEIPIEGVSGSTFYNRRDSYADSARARVAKTTYIGIAGITDEEKKKIERKENGGRTIASGEDFAPPPKKIPIKKPEPKIQAEAEDSPMTFGNFFRFLLIAAIVIAIIVVLGSQALKFAKSQEK